PGAGRGPPGPGPVPVRRGNPFPGSCSRGPPPCRPWPGRADRAVRTPRFGAAPAPGAVASAVARDPPAHRTSVVVLLGSADGVAGQPSRLFLSVDGLLQEHDRRDLIHYVTRPALAAAGGTESRMGRNGAEPFVDQPHRC